MVISMTFGNSVTFPPCSLLNALVNRTKIVSNDGLSQGWCQATAGTNAVWLLIRYLVTTSRAKFKSQYSNSTEPVEYHNAQIQWWRHQMETFSASLSLCAGNSPVAGEFPIQRPMARSFDVFFDLHLNKRLSKQSWGWCCQTL